VDDILNHLHKTFSREEFKEFGDYCRQFKIVHRCLDGVGINYTRDKIISIKGYCKILDEFPKFSDRFLRGFTSSSRYKSALLNLCSNSSACLGNRDTGLAGVNLGLKFNIESQVITKSAYIKTCPKKVNVISFAGDQVSEDRYSYIFSRPLIFFLNKFFQLHIPKNPHGIEFSRRKAGTFATVYPIFPSKTREKIAIKYLTLFNSLQSVDPWKIEHNLLRVISGEFPNWSPITKGYESGGDSRKIYLGRFSYNHSSFDYFKY
tara:strand:+ start:37796 stop:38581 length:786 start_codon:yes stop_codon:yes gene_type:complete